MRTVYLRHNKDKNDFGNGEYKKQTWRMLKKNSRGKNIILYGAGVACKEFLDQYGSRIEVEKIIDSNEELVGTVIQGKKVFSPNDISKESYENDVFIISAVNYEEEISERLKDLGAKNIFSLYAVISKKECTFLGNKVRLWREYWFGYRFGILSPINVFNNFVIFHILAILRVLRIPPVFGKYKNILKYKDLYKGKRCFIVATGPSLRVSDLELLKKRNEITFSMNLIFTLYDQTEWRPDFYVVEDPKFLKLYDWKNEVDTDKLCKNTAFFPDMYRKAIVGRNVVFYPLSYLGHLMKQDDEKLKYCKDFLWGIYCAYTVTNVCIQLANYMGFSEVYLLGSDCNYKTTSKHSTKERDENIYTDEYADQAHLNLIRGFDFIGKHVEKDGTKVFNATRGGQLEVFERVNFDDLMMCEENDG